MKLSLFDTDGSLTGEYRALPAAFVCGALPDTKDTDDDGLPDAWERCYNGLDPTTADADAEPDNDELSNREEYELIEKRLWVNTPTWSAGHSDESRVLIVNVEHSLWSPDSDLITTATFEVPDSVVIESAQIESDIANGYPDYVTHACSIGGSAICEINNADYHYRYLDIYIHYYVVQPGSHDIVWRFAAELLDKKQDVLSQTTVVEQYWPTTSLQALIDAAIAVRTAW